MEITPAARAVLAPLLAAAGGRVLRLSHQGYG